MLSVCCAWQVRKGQEDQICMIQAGFSKSKQVKTMQGYTCLYAGFF